MKKFLSLCLIPMIALCMIPTVACTASQVNTTVSQINAYLPTVLALLQDGITIYQAVGATDPTTTAPTLSGLQLTKTDLTALGTEVSTYLATTSSSATQATAWSNIQTLVDTITTNTDQTLQLASVKNSNSTAQAVVVLASLDAAVHILGSYVAAAQTPAQVQATASARALKLKTISQHWSPKDKQNIAKALGVSYDTAYTHAVALGL